MIDERGQMFAFSFGLLARVRRTDHVGHRLQKMKIVFDKCARALALRFENSPRACPARNHHADATHHTVRPDKLRHIERRDGGHVAHDHRLT